MLAGKILAMAAMYEDKHVTWFPSYGAEVRGGTAHCMVVISDMEIGAPCIDSADTVIAMNKMSADKFKARVARNGLMLVNSSLVGDMEGDGVSGYPFTETAVRLGDARVANMVAVGCYLALKKIVEAQTVRRVIEEIAPAGKEGLIAINHAALEEGMKCAGRGRNYLAKAQ